MRERPLVRDVRRVAAVEMRQALRDGRVRLLGVLAAALTAAAVAAGWARRSDEARERSAAAAASRAQWEGQGTRNPHSAAHFGVWAYRPVPAMAAVDPGLLPWSGAAVWIEAHYQNPLQLRPADDATSLIRFGDGSPAHIVQVLLPLLLLLLGHRAVAGERDQNTWPLLLGAGASPHRIVAGKLLALLGVTALAVAPGLVIAALAIAWEGDPAALGRLGLFALAALLYLSVHALAVSALSAWARGARTALLCGLIWWFATCIAAPRAAAAAADSLVEVPTATEFWERVHTGMDQGIDGHDPADQRARALEVEVLARHGVSRVEDLPINFDGVRLQAGEEYGNRVFDLVWGDVRRRIADQDRVLDAAGVASPLLGFRRASMAAAGTDAAHEADFAGAAESYRRELNRALNTHIAQSSRTGEWDFAAGRELWTRMPAFTYRAPQLGFSAPALAVGFGSLLAWLCAAAGALWFALRRGAS